MSAFYDDLETRTRADRETAQLTSLLAQIKRVEAAENSCLTGGDSVQCLADLPHLPVLRKSALSTWQSETPPFGGIPVSNITHVFQSPGPIYEPGGSSHDW